MTDNNMVCFRIYMTILNIQLHSQRRHGLGTTKIRILAPGSSGFLKKKNIKIS